MRRFVPLLVLAIGVATMAEAAVAPVSKPATNPTSTPKTTQTAPVATKVQAAPKAKPAPAAESRMRLGFRAIGGALGFVSPENADGAISLGVFADCGQITPQISLEPRLDFWSKSEEAYGMKASASDVILGARGKYRFETSNPKLHPFAGAGLSLHFIHTEASVPVPPGYPPMTAEDSATRLGLDIGGGVSTPVGPRSDLMGEMWYGFVTGAGQLSLRVGMSYRLGD